MNLFHKKLVFTILFFFCINSSFSQNNNDKSLSDIPFQPMFSFGTSYYNFQGDIMGPQTNTLLGNMGYNAGVRFNLSLNIDAVLQFSENSFYEANATNNFTSDISSISAKIGYSMFENAIISPYYSLGLNRLVIKQLKMTYLQKSIYSCNSRGCWIKIRYFERIDLDTVSYTTSNSDIDKYLENNNGSNDNFLGVNFILHYDLFTPNLILMNTMMIVIMPT